MTSEGDLITTQAPIVCNLCDCVSVGNKGDEMVQKVFEKFNYANCYVNRVATTKSLPGSMTIKGDGKQNRFVINMFTQYYPGPPKYPNDNILKRVEWFSKCLDELLNIETTCFSFPTDIGLYDGDERTCEHNIRYLDLLDDFRKKYYLKHNKHVKIVDYQDHSLIEEIDEKTPKYDQPIKVLRVDEADPIVHSKKRGKIRQEIDITHLVYVKQPPTFISQPEPKPVSQPEPKPVLQPEPKSVSQPEPKPVLQPEPKPVSQPEPKPVLQPEPKPVSQPEPKPVPQPEAVLKPKITIKLQNPVPSYTLEPAPAPAPAPVPAPVPAPAHVSVMPVMRKYDMNPTWTKTISELATEVHPSWEPIFKHPKILGLLPNLDRVFSEELEKFGDAITILPVPQDNIFNAFKLCQFPVKVVCVGQDCYYENVNQAMGLAFSVAKGVKIPSSLINIFKELETDLGTFKKPLSGDLTKWAQQGVLLVNSALTVRHQQKATHMAHWRKFTDMIIQLVSERSTTPIVFMLWGNYAKEKIPLIMNAKKHCILSAAHPSGLSASGGFFGCKHFSQCNTFLKTNKMTPIDWNL
jgi:uracil-DNA glycosylase